MSDQPTAELIAENERLRLAILDIDAHATPLGEDDEAFVSVGYAISVGCLHRALGLVGHSAPKGITRVDLESDFRGVGIPIGASALIWRAARELEAIAAALPEGVSIEQLVATYNAVHDPTHQHVSHDCCLTRVRNLRSVTP